MICDTLFVIRAMYLTSQSIQLCLNYLANFCHTETFYRIYLILLKTTDIYGLLAN